MTISRRSFVAASAAVFPGLLTMKLAAGAEGAKKPAATFEVYKDKRGEYRWRLRAQNKQILASSGEGYAERRNCVAAIESVKKAAADAPVVDVQEKEAEKAVK